MDKKIYETPNYVVEKFNCVSEVYTTSGGWGEGGDTGTFGDEIYDAGFDF